jgi:protein-disulfide isomerase
MQNSRSQRGRSVRAKSRRPALSPFQIILGVVAIAGIAVFVWLILRGQGNNTTAATPNTPANTNPAANANLPTLSLDSFPSKGNADAPVTVVEYADFQCPGCAAFATQLALQIQKDYVDTGKVRFIFHDLPLPQHTNSIPASEASRCAADQNAFWPMHDLIYANQVQWSQSQQPRTQFSAYAASLGLDTGAFDQCMLNGTHRTTILAAQRQAANANIQSTPTFVIGDKQFGANELRAGIEAALAGN